MTPDPRRVALCGPCTLDGQPAEVRAPLQSEAQVQTLDPSGPSIRVSWEIVESRRARHHEYEHCNFYTAEYARTRYRAGRASARALEAAA